LVGLAGFGDFFRLPQVSDVINDYVEYVISGKLSANLLEMFKERMGSTSQEKV